MIKKMLIFLTLFFASILPVFADIADINETIGGNINLLAIESGKNDENIEAVFQIKLKQGWKTYWKTPGTTGIPPKLSFNKSSNLKDTTLKLPVPKVFWQDKSIGYENDVNFIIKAKKINKEKQAILHIEGLIGLCEKICVPIPIDLQLKINGKKHKQIIEKAKQKLPLDFHKQLKIVSALVKNDNIIITTDIPNNAKKTALFANLQGGITKQIGKNSFSMKLYEKISQKTIDFLLVVDNIAIEQTITLKRNLP